MAALQSNLLMADADNIGDEESVMERFAWATIGYTHIPYIFRNGDKFCSLRIVQEKLLNNLLCFIHPDVVKSVPHVKSYYVSVPECVLLNKINIDHCDFHYGIALFTLKDCIVRLNDVEEFYAFLNACYSKLLNGSVVGSTDFGLYKISGSFVVPYVVVKEARYVPLIYFCGEIEYLTKKAVTLEGWKLAYLKFCMKVQGVDGERYARDSCLVVNVKDLTNYFPPGTKFEEYWPAETGRFLVNRQSPVIQWAEPPTSPKPSAEEVPDNQTITANASISSN